MVYDSARQRMVLFGGWQPPSHELGDTWEYNGTDWVQITTSSSPTPRNCHGMVYRAVTGRVVLFGGWEISGSPLNDTWEYDGATWTKISTLHSPAPRRNFGIAYDSARDRVIVFGGCSGRCSSTLNDTWEFDGTDWYEVITAVSPGSRAGHSMIYDSSRRHVVMFGGCSALYNFHDCVDGPLSDTWEYDGSTWTPIQTSAAPSPRYQHMLGYDNLYAKTLLFGGREAVSSMLADTWEYDGTSTIGPVSADRSSLQASSTSAPADGTTTITLTVTLRDASDRPVPGKTARLYSDRGGFDVISQPTAPTDLQGQTTGTVVSIVPGVSVISAVDVTDNVRVTQRVSIEFTGVVIPPNEELRRSINILDQVTRQRLGLLSNLAAGVAEDAEALQDIVAADAAKAVYDSIWGFISVVVPGTTHIADAAGWKLPGFLREADWGAARYLKERHPQAGDFCNLELWLSVKSGVFHTLPSRAWNDGLMFYAARLADAAIEQVTTEMAAATWQDLFQQKRWNEAANLFSASVEDTQSAVLERRDVLLNGIPPMTDARQREHAAELQSRATVPVVLVTTLQRQADVLHYLRQARESVGEGGVVLFLLKFGASNAANIMWPGVGKILFDGILTSFDLYLDQHKVDADKRGLLNAESFFQGAPGLVQQVYGNAYEGFEGVRLDIPPRPIAGAIEDVQHYSRGIGWGPVWQEHGSYSDIQIANRSLETATFMVMVEYGYNSTLLGLPWTYTPMTELQPIKLDPGESGTVRVKYKEEERGGSPDSNSDMHIYLLANNDRGIFYVGHRAETWKPQRVGLSGLAATTSTVATDTLAVENPIDAYIVSNPDSQTYEAELWIANPFTATIAASITQTLPAAVSVVTADGTIAGSIVTWSETIPANGIVSATFTFRDPAQPGTPLSLPAATMAFTEPTSGQFLTTQSNIPTFEGQWPVMVEIYAPQTRAGVGASMPVTVANLITGSIQGSVTIVISDAVGTQVFSQTQPFTLSGSASGTLVFDLLGTLPGGFYPLEGWLDIGEERQRVLADLYRIGASGPTIRALVEPVGFVWAGQVLSYTVQVTNTTALTLTNAVLSTTIPISTHVVSGSISHGGAASDGSIGWTLGSLYPGATVQRTFQVQVADDAVRMRHTLPIQSLPSFLSDQTILTFGLPAQNTVVNQAPSLGAAEPSSSTARVGATRYFTATYVDGDSYADLAWCYFLIGSSTVPSNTVYLSYDQTGGKLFLRDDNDSAWLGGYAPGSANTIQNSQASLDCSKSQVIEAGDTITMNLALRFQSSYTGTKALYLKATDLVGSTAGWEQKGTVAVQPGLEGDMDADCDVGIVDIMLVASRWGTRQGDANYDARYDLDSDGDIDVVDIMRVAAHWSEVCDGGP